MALFYVTGRQLHKEECVPMSPDDFNHNSPFSPHRKSYPVTPLPHDKTPQSHKKKRMHVYTRKTKLCTKYRLLLLLLVFFVLLAFVMASLLLWQVQLNGKGRATAPLEENQKALAAHSCLPLPKPIALPDLSQFLQNKLKKMEEYISVKMNKKFGALSANLVYRDQIIWSGTFGVMNKSEKPPRKPKASSIYPCASISKVFTALIVYKLLDENKISSLDDPVTKYDADFKIINPFDNHKMTLRNLLAMDSGIPREAPCYPSKNNNMCPYDHNTMIKRIQNTSLLVEPNTIMQYSNFGYSLLGNIIAKRFTGGDYNALVKKYVLDPLEMHSTTLALSQSQLNNVPAAYEEDGKLAKVYKWGWLDPAGGFSTTVQDLAKLVIQLMSDDNRGRYLSKYITRQLLSVANIMPDGKAMSGTPWEMELIDGIVHREKGGSVYGYEGKVSLVPELRIALNVLCTNCAEFLSSLIRTSFVKDIVPALKQHLRKKQHQKIELPSNYKAYVGSYKTDGVPSIHSFVIVKDKNKLLAYINNNPIFYLNYTAPRTFRFVVNTAKMNCMSTYILANMNDPVVFEEISNRDGLSHGFTLYGAHPSGKTYMYRVPSS